MRVSNLPEPEMTVQTQRLARVTHRLAQARHHAHEITERLLRAEKAEIEMRVERDAILSSTSWKVTALIRSLANWLPASVRKALRKAFTTTS